MDMKYNGPCRTRTCDNTGYEPVALPAELRVLIRGFGEKKRSRLVLLLANALQIFQIQ